MPARKIKPLYNLTFSNVPWIQGFTQDYVHLNERMIPSSVRERRVKTDHISFNGNGQN